ncbi:MAG TPA: glycosyltransferase family 9 protein [Candidatus Binatia bacterium]|nr:glycosyltransferase family 9 protein [Candidatus Binatia bacterium]
MAQLGPLRKVVVLRASRIGDFVCATPALRALRAAACEAEITLVTLPLLRELAERCPDVDRFAPFPGFPGLAEQLFDPRAATTFFQAMQAEQFDLAIQLQGSGVHSNPFTLMLGAQHTAGFVRPGEEPSRLLAAALPLPQSGHEIDRVLALVRFLGAPAAGRTTRYELWPADHAEAERLLASASAAARPLVGLHPGAWDAERRWPVDRFAALGRALRARYGATLVILGSHSEQRRTADLAAALDGACLNLGGQTGLGSVGAVIARLALLVTNDSGPAHIAYALRTPTVTVAHGCDQERYGPPLSGPFSLVHPPKTDRGGLARLPLDPVLSAAVALLEEYRRVC